MNKTTKTTIMKGFTKINPATYPGGIPAGSDLVVCEDGDIDSALTLHGFDEIGMFDSEFKNPVHGFLDLSTLEEIENIVTINLK